MTRIDDLRIRAVMCVFLGGMIGQARGYWPPTEGITIHPERPTSYQVIDVALSGRWPDVCEPRESVVTVQGNDIYFDVIDTYRGECLVAGTEWQQSQTIGPLPAGQYTVYARLLGDPCVPETYALMTEFFVVGPRLTRWLEAQLMALEISGEFQPPTALAEQIYQDLEIIRTSFPEIAEVSYRPSADPYEIMVGLTEEALAQFRRGEYHELDVLNDLYGVVGLSRVSSHGILLEFSQLYNTTTLAAIYESAGAEGVRYVERNSMCCDGSTIAADPPFYTFVRKWGDCPMGCTGGEHWSFIVEAGEARPTNLMPAGFGTIQAAIDEGLSGTLTLAMGVYNENIIFAGRHVSLTSIDPDDPCVVAATIIQGTGEGPVVTFGGREASNCVLTGLTIRGGDNASGRGGGICGNDTLATISKCVITDNIAANGGGISDCDGAIRECVITGNAASNNGGGLVACHGEITNCVIQDNSATRGGGMNNCNGVIENCTIANNAANEGGGTRRCDGEIANCIIWDNMGGDLWEGSEPSYSCFVGAGGTNIEVDPCFVDAAGWDYHLRLDSRCVDEGGPRGGASVRDIDGYARVVDGDGDGLAVVDMGADEVGAVGCWHSSTQCYGDMTGDEYVDTVDWTTFRDAFGTAYPEGRYNPCGDLDRDGDVDGDDWRVFRDHFSATAPTDCSYDGVWPPGVR